jgi:alpha-1,3-rhamnosyl/mannosyltransferase
MNYEPQTGRDAGIDSLSRALTCSPISLSDPVGFGVTVLERALAHGGHLDGIGTYTQALLARFRVDRTPIDPWSFPIDGVPHPDGSHPSWFKRGFAYSAIASACTGLPFEGSRGFEGRIGLFHATDHLIPKLSVPVLANIMDPIPLMRSGWIKSSFHRQKSWLFRQSTGWADHYLTISSYVADDLADRLKVARERITSIHLGVDERYFEQIREEDKAQALARLGLRPGFFLKNIGVLIDAFEQLPVELQRTCPLVVVGRRGWSSEKEIERLGRLEANGTGRWLDYVTNADKRTLMQSATALVFPSLYEGFGLPVLEAFASGLPVIASNTTSIPEVAGGAGLLINPGNPEEIAFSMRRLAEDSALASDLSTRGALRVQSFTWTDTARKTAALYQKMMN